MALLQYDFKVVNANAVDKAFAGIERRAMRHNQRMNRTFSGASGTAATGGKTGTSSATTQAERDVRIAERAAVRKAAAERREQEKLAKWRQGLQNRHYQTEEKFRKRQDVMATRDLQRRELERRRVTRGTMGTIGRSAGGTMRAVGSLAGGALAIGGGFAVSAAIGQQSRETTLASKLANQSGNPAIKGQLLREGQSVRGFTGEEGLNALSGFVELTGDLETARNLLKDLGKISLATGTEFADMSILAGNFANNLESIKDPAKKAAAVMAAIKTASRQGETGSVEVSKMASQGGTFGAIAGGIGGDPVKALKTAGTLIQVAKRKTGSVEEAMTAASNFIDFSGTHADKIEGLGINDAFVKGKDGANTGVRDPLKLIADIFDKTGGDIGTVTKIFGQRGQNVFKGFADLYNEIGSDGKRKGRAGIYERASRFNQTLSDAQINKRAESRMEDPDMKFKEAMKNFNSEVGSELLPVIADLVPTFAALTPHVATAAKLLGKFVEQLASNPLGTVFTIMAAKIAADLAAARIGNVIKTGIENSIAGTGRTGTGGTATPGGKGAAVMNGLSLGVGTALTIIANGVVNFEQRNADMDTAGKRLNMLRGMGGADLTEATALMDQQRTVSEKTAAPTFLESLIGGAFEAAAIAAFGSDAPKGSTYDPRNARNAGAALGASASAMFGDTELMVARKTQLDLEKQMASEISRIQREAATEIRDAAKNLSAQSLNRGNTPSPVVIGP